MDNLSGKAQSPETEGGWLSRERVLALVLLVATGLAVYVCYRLTRPFLPALAWALALAVVAHPLHDWIERRLRRANLAAAVAVVLVAVAIGGPTVLLTQRLGREVAWGVGWVQSEYTSGHWRAAIERHPWLATALSWFGGGVDVGGAAERLLSTLSSNISSVLTGSVWAVAELLITLFARFYFFRDRAPRATGPAIAGAVFRGGGRGGVPTSRRHDLCHCLRDADRGTSAGALGWVDVLGVGPPGSALVGCGLVPARRLTVLPPRETNGPGQRAHTW
jgi:hypothetical protein